MYHSLLNRQLKKERISEDGVPEKGQWLKFLARVSRAYADADQERYLLERSLMISSEEMKETFDELQQSEMRYALAAKGANDGLWDWDFQNDAVYYSERWNEIMGIVQPSGKKPTKELWIDRVHPDDRAEVIREMREHLNGLTEQFRSEHRVMYKFGAYRWVLARGLAIRNADGVACRISGSMTDISARKSSEAKIAYDALHDKLTGLPNRAFLTEKVNACLRKKRRNPDYHFGLLFIDLDRFKTINDILGHQCGDQLLIGVGKMLKELCRPSDTLARPGGDEFVLLLDNMSGEEYLEKVAEMVMDTLQTPIRLANRDVYSTASIGIASGSELYESPEELIRDADSAMYKAKARGKARFEKFDIESRVGSISTFDLELDLRRAIETNEFVLHYQPVVSLKNSSIVGFEALIRWEHPQKGLIPPNDFIPIAEETGLIVQIGQWGMREACSQLSAWQKSYRSAANLVMSVNLSARQFDQKDIAGMVCEVLEDTRLSPNCLNLEITESVIISNTKETAEIVDKLRKIGVKFALDDFGTGYSSLSYLSRLPVDYLKMDHSFVSRISEKGGNAELIKGIINLARSLGMAVVAEGIETAEQSDMLRQLDCTYGQGFLYSRPVDKIAAAKIISGIKEEKSFVFYEASSVPMQYEMLQ